MTEQDMTGQDNRTGQAMTGHDMTDGTEYGRPTKQDGI